MEYNSGSNRASNFKSIIGWVRSTRPIWNYEPEEKYEQCMGKENVRSYYMLNHRIRGLLFHYKKVIFWVRVFRSILIPSVRMTLTMSKMFARSICQTIEWEVNYSTAKKMSFWLLFCGKSIQNFLQFSHSCSFCIRRYSPSCKPVKPGHYSVLRPRILRVLLTL